jgi:hypothetical protein
MSFANILKRETSSANIASAKHKISDIQLKDLLDKKILTNNQINKKNILLNETEKLFLDYNGELIYDFYSELRKHFENTSLLKKIDYNGFLDIFIDNIQFVELYHDSDDETNNDMEDNY